MEKTINFAAERMKRRYLPELIKEFKSYIHRSDTLQEDADLANTYIKDAEEAIKKLEAGDPSKAQELIDFDIKRIESWKKTFIDTSGNPEQIAEAQKKIDELVKIKEELG